MIDSISKVSTTNNNDVNDSNINASKLILSTQENIDRQDINMIQSTVNMVINNDKNLPIFDTSLQRSSSYTLPESISSGHMSATVLQRNLLNTIDIHDEDIDALYKS